MTREEIILKHIKRNGRGLEIGPGCAPIASKKQGGIFSLRGEQSPAVLPGTRAKKASSSLCIHSNKRNKQSAM
jgi:hypothetical protein